MTDISSIKNPALYALDLNSGVEDSPGQKNLDKVKTIRALLADAHDEDDSNDEDKS